MQKHCKKGSDTSMLGDNEKVALDRLRAHRGRRIVRRRQLPGAIVVASRKVEDVFNMHRALAVDSVCGVTGQKWVRTATAATTLRCVEDHHPTVVERHRASESSVENRGHVVAVAAAEPRN